MKIYKYLLSREYGPQDVEMQGHHASVFSFGLDPNRNLCVWALVNDEDPCKVKRQLFLGLTGQEVPLLPIPGLPNAKATPHFIGTCIDEGAFVIHCFDLGQR